MTPGSVLGWVIELWLAAIVVLIAYRVLTGRISLRGVFTKNGDRFSPERLQLFAVTLSLLVTYMHDSLSTAKMQAPSAELLAIFAASNVLYLGGKIAGR
jgi:hypothetical protein